MITEEAVQLIGELQYEEALPLAMDAVQIGQKLFYPRHTPQLVPLYLMVIQANLGLERVMQSEDLLGLAAWLLLQDTSGARHNAMRAELGRLYGQLHVIKGNVDEALKAYSEEIYYNSLEYGVYDTHTSVSFFHLGQVHRSLGRTRDHMACCDLVIESWLPKLKELVFDPSHVHGCGLKPDTDRVHVECTSPLAHVHSHEMTKLLQEISQQRAESYGPHHVRVGEAFMAQGLLHLYNHRSSLAMAALEHASSVVRDKDQALFQLCLEAIRMLQT
ncbi:uncharacterized protein LOC112342176 [Selaginella moellendorffii]|uniref:uncharacterized protein LOC112342176 n=1 Tax=Selaginella moellendorffii TaxID=88036 RepID=UPI000D1CD68B|nr:uncharacterized protein LOC112342176 [Selaginella moellendorffii]|eukprot:XP_024519362.1 uncharacterized protein LOC112342176 [Selaginella moellendorffii]